MGRCGLDSSGSGHGPVVVSYEHGEKPSGSINGEKFLNYLIDYQLLKRDSVPRSYVVRRLLSTCINTLWFRFLPKHTYCLELVQSSSQSEIFISFLYSDIRTS
jgi:hypothetical protein